jgi:glycosyltransferase involved in cell wall biosynthesis
VKIGLVVPHIFMQDKLLPDVIFSPGKLAISLADGLTAMGHEVTLFTPGPVTTKSRNQTTDLGYFESELDGRGYGYIELLKKHPLTFISLARQAQSELIAEAIDQTNRGLFDILHIYGNEEDVGLPFLKFCTKPVILTHHDPFNFNSQYRTVFPKYKEYNWLSISLSQRDAMPPDTNWAANIYHGLPGYRFRANLNPKGNYIAYSGRIIESKGVHLAIDAVKRYNRGVPEAEHLTLRLAGRHYAGQSKDTYWNARILPEIDKKTVFYDGFLKSDTELQKFLGNARALIVPSTFEEPFGMVMIEALACGTPLIGLEAGAIPEIILAGQTGYPAPVSRKPGANPAKQIIDEEATAASLAEAIGKISDIGRPACRADFEARFTLERMCREHAETYARFTGLPAAP